MKKTVILICSVLILCAAVSIAAVHFTGKNDASESSDSQSYKADDTTAQTTADYPFVDLSESRGYGLSLVQIDKESPRYWEPCYEREDAEAARTVNILGKTVTARYVETVQWVGNGIRDKYEDEDGNSYSFSEDGTFLSYIGENELSSFSIALYADKGIAPDITEDEAAVIAENAGKETFGEAFDKVKLESIEYKDGIYDVYYTQRLGADSSLNGLYYHASILADGRIYSFGMPNIADLAGLDESRYSPVTKEAIEQEIAVNAAKVFGEKKVDFPVNEVMSICILNGKYVLHAMSETRSGGADIYYEVTDLNNSK